MTTENMSRTEARSLRSFCLAALENMAVKRSHPAFKVGEKVWILLPGRVEEATVKAQTQQRDHYLELAKKADEGFREGEAIENLKKALDYDPEAPVYFRVGKWILEKEKDPRRALTLYRKAVEKKPESNEYRLALGDLYAAVKMELNARREYQVVLDRDKKNEKAKAALARLGKG